MASDFDVAYPSAYYNTILIIVCILLLLLFLRAFKKIYLIAKLRISVLTNRVIHIPGLSSYLYYFDSSTNSHLNAIIHTRQSKPPQEVRKIYTTNTWKACKVVKSDKGYNIQLKFSSRTQGSLLFIPGVHSAKFKTKIEEHCRLNQQNNQDLKSSIFVSNVISDRSNVHSFPFGDVLGFGKYVAYKSFDAGDDSNIFFDLNNFNIRTKAEDSVNDKVLCAMVILSDYPRDSFDNHSKATADDIESQSSDSRKHSDEVGFLHNNQASQGQGGSTYHSEFSLFKMPFLKYFCQQPVSDLAGSAGLDDNTKEHRFNHEFPPRHSRKETENAYYNHKSSSDVQATIYLFNVPNNVWGNSKVSSSSLSSADTSNPGQPQLDAFVVMPTEVILIDRMKNLFSSQEIFGLNSVSAADPATDSSVSKNQTSNDSSENKEDIESATQNSASNGTTNGTTPQQSSVALLEGGKLPSEECVVCLTDEKRVLLLPCRSAYPCLHFYLF